MPTLAQLIGTGSDPTLTQVTTTLPVVEPLDGPTTVDDVFDRFPEEVYQQGRDTHLYRLLTALGGDSGAGLIKAQAYAARLKTEAEFLNFSTLDDLYGVQFRFKRLKDETYPDFNPDTDALTPTEWDSILLADQNYRQRVAEFFTATRSGNSPDGLTVAAQSGSGVECEIVENYRWIFDQFSDDPLGLPFEGTTNSTSEFIVIPRFINSSDDSLSWTQTNPVVFTPTTYPGTFDSTQRPSLGGTFPTVAGAVSTSTTITSMDPAVERNMLDILDRMRPTDTIASVNPEETRYASVTIQDAHGSSERVHVNRLVYGKAEVPWPALDRSQAFFISAGIENEAGSFYGAARELPTIFQTPENVHAYTDGALTDPTYGTDEFYDASTGISAYDSYRSEHLGVFDAVMQAIYPFLATVQPNTQFTADQAIAVVDTPLVLEGRAV